LQTQYSSIYSQGNVGSSQTPLPPAGEFNATYCILAGGSIHNFYESAAGCGSPPGIPRTGYATPSLTLTPQDVGSIARLDIAGILKGRYGEIIGIVEDDFKASGIFLDGKVRFRDGGNLHVYASGASLDFTNSAGSESGAGLFVVRGGNLHIHSDLGYDNGSVTNVRGLASPGWLVLRDQNGNGGNLYIDPKVTELVGAFYVEGKVMTGSGTPTVASDDPLVVRGVIAAQQFNFERKTRSDRPTPAERIIADGRAVANPPPGFGDFVKALPIIRSAAP
ncbi:MAG: hypothetical protein V1723_02630, partial [Candidatus Uhrbacteria bacterium]